jgi:hypothetical protein
MASPVEQRATAAFRSGRWSDAIALFSQAIDAETAGKPGGATAAERMRVAVLFSNRCAARLKLAAAHFEKADAVSEEKGAFSV